MTPLTEKREKNPKNLTVTDYILPKGHSTCFQDFAIFLKKKKKKRKKIKF